MRVFSQSERHRALDSMKRIYDQTCGVEEIEALQLRGFNKVWAKALRDSVFYQRWQSRFDLPDTIADLNELDNWPILTKQDVRENEALIFGDLDRNEADVTGGTTSEPTKFPSHPSEHTVRYANNWVGRSWWGITPTERSALMWGHRHLFGTGIQRIINRTDRYIRDAITHTLRLNGYLISDADSRSHAQRILKYRPQYLIGYTSALVRLARVFDDELIAKFSDLQLKGTIVTSDNLNERDEVLLRERFGCPVIMEYGAAEAGVIAVSRGETRNVATLWESQLVRQDDVRGIALTTLYDRVFPLINYGLGDVLVPRTISPGGSIIAIESVAGRVLDVLRFASRDGEIVTPAAQITDLFELYEDMHAVQYTQENPGRVGIHVRIEPGTTLDAIEQHFWKNIRRAYPQLERASVRFIDEPEQMLSRSGKHLVIRPSTDA
ncbi:MAG: hypothetical protein ACTHXA_03450 [Gulosibacter sp.]|uniref:hypothetical protein n=1 Tax=Gulosibacter sp. TaxID=2817531 RepID=UPI003F8FF2E4